MNLAAFLVGLVGPLMARWLASVGLSMVALTGATVALSTLTTAVQNYVGGLPGDVLALGGLMGCWAAIGIILGAFSFSLTWKSTKGFWALAKK